MGMYGDRDVIVHPKQWQPMLTGDSACADRALSPCRAFPHAGRAAGLLPKDSKPSWTGSADPFPQSSHPHERHYTSYTGHDRLSIFLSKSHGEDHSSFHGRGDGTERGAMPSSNWLDCTHLHRQLSRR
ncbi:MAG: hypothetical protein MZV64_19675 [Ignavibacteriales bacterium]|nr:hypothetical protein [Ignavibacteriales bacterium]